MLLKMTCGRMLKWSLEQYFFSAFSAARNERVALHIITLTTAEVVVSFTIRPLDLHGKSPWYPSDRSLDGLKPWCERFEEESFLPWRKSKHDSLVAGHRLVNVLRYPGSSNCKVDTKHDIKYCSSLLEPKTQYTSVVPWFERLVSDWSPQRLGCNRGWVRVWFVAEKWRWNAVSFEYFALPLSVSFYQCPMLIRSCTTDTIQP
jgi:hypothetical protein